MTRRSAWPSGPGSGSRKAANRAIREGLLQGLERGRQEGLEHERFLLRRMAASRFGAGTAERLSVVLARITEPERLAEVGEWLVRCDSGAELLAHASPAPAEGDPDGADANRTVAPRREERRIHCPGSNRYVRGLSQTRSRHGAPASAAPPARAGADSLSSLASRDAGLETLATMCRLVRARRGLHRSPVVMTSTPAGLRRREAVRYPRAGAPRHRPYSARRAGSGRVPRGPRPDE